MRNTTMALIAGLAAMAGDFDIGKSLPPTPRTGRRHGKHNGRNKGAFGKCRNKPMWLPGA